MRQRVARSAPARKSTPRFRSFGVQVTLEIEAQDARTARDIARHADPRVLVGSTRVVRCPHNYIEPETFCSACRR